MVLSPQLALVTVNPVTSAATVSPECTWRDVIDAAAPYGLVAIHAFDQNLRAAESIRRNEFSPYSRLLGASADSVVSMGPPPDSESEFDLELFPMSGGFSGATFWDVSAAQDVVPPYLHWARTAPPQVTTRLSVISIPARTPKATRTVLRVDGLVATRQPSETAKSKTVLRDFVQPLVTAATPISHRWPATTNRLRHVDPKAADSGEWLRPETFEALSSAELLEIIAEAARLRNNVHLNQLGGQMSVGRLSGRPGTHPSAAYELVRAVGVGRK
jgi:hypothetical protein